MKLLLTIMGLAVGVSLACSGYKSAGSPTAPNNKVVTTQVSGTNENAPKQDKPKCTLTVASTPAFNGLRLGMTHDEVLALFPGSKEDAEIKVDLAKPPGEFGTSGFQIRPAKYENKEKFTGISQIAVNFLDGRLSDFIVHYNGPQYSHVDKFLEKFIEGTNLPPVDQWEGHVGMDTQMKTLSCAQVEIRVYAGGPGGNLNYVSMRDLEADKTIIDRDANANKKPTPGN